jgi:hypothetical protein
VGGGGVSGVWGSGVGCVATEINTRHLNAQTFM